MTLHEIGSFILLFTLTEVYYGFFKSIGNTKISILGFLIFIGSGLFLYFK